MREFLIALPSRLSIGEVRIGISRAEVTSVGVPTNRRRISRGGDDRRNGIANGDDPVGGVSRAGVLDDDAAGHIHIDAAVLPAAVVALDAVVARGNVDPRPVA